MKSKRNGADWLPFQTDRKHWGEKKVSGQAKGNQGVTREASSHLLYISYQSKVPKDTQPWHTYRLFHVMFSAYDILPEISTSIKVVLLVFFSNGMWSSSGVPKPCWRGSCKNILQTSSYRKGEQTQELDDLSEQQKSSRNIPKWYQTLNELTSGFHRWLCPGQILDENSLG